MKLLEIIIDLLNGSLKFRLKLERIKVSKNQEYRINQLSELLVNEFNLLIPEEVEGVKHIDIYFDCIHHEYREIETSSILFDLSFKNITKKKNKNYKA